MKKSLIALAVLGMSGAAMAQSSVTLYGVADAGIGKMEAGTDKTEFLSATMMNNGNSRIGVRGVEDLGGGLRAGFNFESGLSLDGGDSAFSGTGMWSRAAHVWLGGNWGTLKLGRSLNPTFYGIAAWELTGAANYSVVGNTYGFAGGGPRNNSQFSYKTPNISGFSAEAGYIFKADNGGASKWDLNATYANGPLGVGFAANKLGNGGKTNYTLGGKYTFGMFTLAGSYTDAHKGLTDLKRRGFSIGGTADIGAFAVTLDVTRDTKNEWTGAKRTNVLAEGRYALSKRTFLYAAYLKYDKTDNYGLGVRHNF